MEISSRMTCPITCQIFKCPVVASDGHTYERAAIREWLLKSNTSPVAGTIINNNLITNYLLISIVDSYLQEHPEERINQYVDLKSISKLIKDQDLTALRHYRDLEITLRFKDMCRMTSEIQLLCIDNNIDILYDGDSLIHHICRNASMEVLRYAINKGFHLEAVDSIGMRPIHIICHMRPMAITDIIDKGVDLEAETINGMRPIHYICDRPHMYELQYLVQKGVNLEIGCYNGKYPIHNICRRADVPNNYKMIKYLIDMGVNLEVATDDGWRPIHLLCRYAAPENQEIIKYVIDKGVDLEAMVFNWRPIHFACCHASFDIIKYLVKQGISLEESILHQWRPIHLLCRNREPEIIKFFLDKVNLEAQTNDGWRPIHIVCRYAPKLETIKSLIEADVNLNIANNDGWLPIHFVKKYARHIVQYMKLYCKTGCMFSFSIRRPKSRSEISGGDLQMFVSLS